MGARVVEDGVAVTSAPSRFDEAGKLVDEELCAELEAVLGTAGRRGALACGGRSRGRQGRLEDSGK